MSFLLERISEETGVNADQGIYDVCYPTGFINFDYLNGFKVIGYDDSGKEFSYDAFGLLDGSYNLIIGRSGCGKTTWAIQAGANIIKQFDEDSELFINSIEGGITIPRLEVLTGLVGDDLLSRVFMKNSGITTESVYRDIRLIYETKIKHKDRYLYDTGLRDSSGAPILKYKPTVLIIDSIALLSPERISDKDEMGGQMDATAMAKANTQLLKGITQLIKSTNIIILAINHITERIEANPFMHTKNQLGYLKQNESLPGGKAVTYLANNIIRFDDSKLKEESFGFSGSTVDVSLAKSRTNKAGKSTTLIFNQELGFDPLFSLAAMLKEEKELVSRGAYMSLKILPEVKFMQKDFKKTYFENEEFRAAFVATSKKVLQALLNQSTAANGGGNNVGIKELIDMFKE